jgi:hypothetical protein
VDELLIVQAYVLGIALDEGRTKDTARQEVKAICLYSFKQSEADFGGFGDFFERHPPQLSLPFQISTK